MSANPTEPTGKSTGEAAGLRGWIKAHPLPAYFVLAFALTWLFVVPIVLSQRGLNIVTLPDTPLLILFLISTFSGPAPAALIVTGITEGREGVGRLLRGIIQWRVGVGWYLLVLLGYPAIFLIGLLFAEGTGPLMALVNNPLLLLTNYLPVVLLGLIYPSLGEEPGWRGFALPHLQAKYHPLAATLILGVLHALWHLPAYTIKGAITEAGWDPLVFGSNSLAIIAATFIWTWLFNNGKGSILFAMYVHAASNATSALIPELTDTPASANPFFAFMVMGAAALVVIAITRGRLSYTAQPSMIGGVEPKPG
jgi:membrane protease YdiL (CAAX protease family)